MMYLCIDMHYTFYLFVSNVHSSYRHVEYIGQLLTEQMNDEIDDEWECETRKIRTYLFSTLATASNDITRRSAEKPQPILKCNVAADNLHHPHQHHLHHHHHPHQHQPHHHHLLYHRFHREDGRGLTSPTYSAFTGGNHKVGLCNGVFWSEVDNDVLTPNTYIHIWW